MEANWEEGSNEPPERALAPPHRGPADAPCPTPRGQPGQPRERLKTGGGLAFCFFIRVGGGVLPTCHPCPHQSHMGDEQSGPHLPVLAPPCFPHVFLQSPPEMWGWDLGEGPQGLVTLLPLSLT